MAMTVADTDVLIDFLSNRAPGADRIAQELERGQLATTAINRFELLAGVRTRRQEKAVHDLLAALLTLPLDQPAADEAAEIRRTLDLAGASIWATASSLESSDSMMRSWSREIDGTSTASEV